MTRKSIASLALLCAFIAGCATDQSGASSPAADPGYTPIGSNIPRRAHKVEAPAANQNQTGAPTTKPAN